MRFISTLTLASFIGLATPALAQRQAIVGDPAAGQELVRRWCSTCHQVDPMRQAQSTDTAPSFVAVANAPTTTSTGLHAFLQTTHGQMPDFRLSRDQIDDVVAYILSLHRP